MVERIRGSNNQGLEVLRKTVKTFHLLSRSGRVSTVATAGLSFERAAKASKAVSWSYLFNE